jgi:hypothetical protein
VFHSGRRVSEILKTASAQKYLQEKIAYAKTIIFLYITAEICVDIFCGACCAYPGQSGHLSYAFLVKS